MQTPDEEISTLLALKQALDNQPNQLVEQSRIVDPSAAIENTLIDFMEETFKSLKKDLDFTDTLKSEILSRISAGSVNENQLISLLINSSTIDNDKISKILGPFTQLSVSKRNAEAAMASANPESTNVFKKMNSETSKEVQQGLATLNMLLSKVIPKNSLIEKPKDDEKIVLPVFDVPPDKEFPIVNETDEIPEVKI